MYESFYKLSGAPFQLMPDPRFLFPSKGHKRALSYLLYGLQRREGFVVITGDVGIGKTLLVQHLIDEIGGRNLSAARVAMANLDADGVLPMVASAFGLSHESRSKVGLLNDLVDKILPTYNHGALLIVDEAQTCTPAALEELRAISNLQARGQALLQVFLVGQSELRTTLAQPGMEQLRQRMITSYHLRPLDVDEVREYVLHRLRAAGWQSDPELGEAIYLFVHEWSQGVPRRINQLMDRLLLYGYLEELHALDASDVHIVTGELDAERGDDVTVEQPEAEATASLSTEDSDALMDRIAGVEKAFTAAVGESRAKQLLDKHEASVQQKALVALNLRIARLESLMDDDADVAKLHDTQQPSAEHAPAEPEPTPPEPEPTPAEPEPIPPQSAPIPSEPELLPLDLEPSAPEPEPSPPEQENGVDLLKLRPDRQTAAAEQHAHHPHVEDNPEENPTTVRAPKWRLFSRR